MPTTGRPYVLLDAVSVDGVGPGVVMDGGPFTLVVQGVSFGGGTVTLELSYDNVIWIPLTEGATPAAYTENTAREVAHIANGLLLRGVLTGSTAADSVSLILA